MGKQTTDIGRGTEKWTSWTLWLEVGRTPLGEKFKTRDVPNAQKKIDTRTRPPGTSRFPPET